MLLRDARANDAFDAREIPYRINVAETGAPEKGLDRGGLPCPDFHHHSAVWIQARSAFGADAAVKLEPVATIDERVTRFMEANLGLERFQIGLGNIWGVRDDQIEAGRAVGKEIGVDELDAILASMANRVAMRNFKRFFRYVDGFDSRFGRIHRDCNRDSSRTGTDVEDARLAARRKKLERGLDQRFSLGPRNENRRRHLEIEREEFLAFNDVGDRLACGAPSDHSAKILSSIGIDVGQPCHQRDARHAARMREKHLGIKARGIDADIAKD